MARDRSILYRHSRSIIFDMKLISDASFGSVILMLFCLTACSSVKSDLSLTDQAVTRFHQQLDSEQYHAIYSGSHAEFRKQAPEDDFVSFAQAVHRKLGHVRYTSLKNFQVRWLAGKGTVVTLFYETQFEEAKAGETFNWQVNDGKPLLYGYNISSNALVTK